MAAQGEREADAALGAVSMPSITVTGALEAYWPLARDKLEGKTEDQVRKFENPRKLAVRMFVDAVGDLELDKVTPDDLLTFRDTLLDKVAESEKFSAGSANKVISNLSSTLRHVIKMKRLPIQLSFGDIKFKDGKKKTRAPFSTEWIRDRLLAPGALDGMNDQARRIFLMQVNTGARPSEIAGMMVEHVNLSANIPMIRIEPEGRELMNHHSARSIPLAGVYWRLRARLSRMPGARKATSCSRTISGMTTGARLRINFSARTA